ncbi:hypothetical protein [Saccharospirillum impatiens]|uniref:hypothetical protein n=1 Tax=Saccharospirillum impatiens TaxID=169438 RepID=UPI0003FF3BF3|nr:hypothetical protein [Saccharospirillum impatiens]
MSTSAESAQQWLSEKQPGLEEVQQVVARLEQRISQHQGEEEAIQGSVEALILLQDHIESEKAPADQPPAASDVQLDNGQLIPEADPVRLEDDVKRRAFEALKNQFKDL